MSERIKKKKGPPPGTGGRPPFEMDWKLFDDLCKIHCTLVEIASVMNTSEDTIERKVKETHGVTFAELFRQKAAGGKASLRRMMYQNAQKGNTALQIFLAKNHLGMSDRIETKQEISATVESKVYICEFTGIEGGNEETKTVANESSKNSGS